MDMEREIVDLYVDDIIPNRFQPREVFDEQALKELSISIKEHGVIQPIIVRKIGDKYEIIAGERRYKATIMAGLTKIPAIIRNLDDKETSKVALLENLQRRDLTAIEEARTYQKILELDQMTQEELGKTMGKSQAAIANKLRLLSLPDEVQEALLKEQISERHARSLLNLKTNHERIAMLKRIIDGRMTVRELDNEIKKINKDTDDTSDEDNGVVLVNEEKQPVSLLTEEEKEEIRKNPFAALEKLLDEAEQKLSESSNNVTTSINGPLVIDDIDEEPELIVSPEENQHMDFDKIVRPTIPSLKQSITVKEAVKMIQDLVLEIRSKGIELTKDEMDFENMYQFIIKIDKNL